MIDDGNKEPGATESEEATGVELWAREADDCVESEKAIEVDDACDDSDMYSDVCEELLAPVA